MRKFIILFLTLLPIAGFSQDSAKISSSDDGNSKNFVFSGGISFQKELMGEVGVMYSNMEIGPCAPEIVAGPKISSEFNFRSSQFIIGPKISYEFDIVALGTRVSLIDYTNFKKSDMCFTPEIGLSVAGMLDVFYGYNIALSSSRTDIPGTHRITLTINI